MNKKIIIIGVIVALAIIGLVIFIFFGKSKDNKKVDTSPGQEHLPTTQSTSSANAADFKIEDIKVGNGTAVKSGDTVSINYIGTLTDGTKFDSTYDRKVPFETKIGVGQVIKGWDKGVVGMKVGGKRKLTIPPSLGYGAQGGGSKIPPNATLIFEVELMGIK